MMWPPDGKLDPYFSHTIPNVFRDSGLGVVWEQYGWVPENPTDVSYLFQLTKALGIQPSFFAADD